MRADDLSPPPPTNQLPPDLERLVGLLDDRWRVPGTRVPVGLDGLLGLIPGVGDTVRLGFGSYIILRAHALGVPRRTLAHMSWNAVVDWFIGLVPLVGDLLDFGFKSNLRNLALIRRDLAAGKARPRQ